jgi:hypothetical protein
LIIRVPARPSRLKVICFQFESALPSYANQSLLPRRLTGTCTPVFARHGSGSSVILERNDFGKERRLGACRGEHSLNVVKQAAPHLPNASGVAGQERRGNAGVSSIASARSHFGPSLDRSASGRRAAKSAQGILNLRELTRFGFVLPKFMD